MLVDWQFTGTRQFLACSVSNRATLTDNHCIEHLTTHTTANFNEGPSAEFLDAGSGCRQMSRRKILLAEPKTPLESSVFQ